MKNSDMPASPIEYCYETHNETTHEVFTGLTKREAFALAAMQGQASHPEFYLDNKDYTKVITKSCVEMADALLAELDK